MTKANKFLNHYIAILAVIALIGILFVPAVSAGKTINYFPTQKAIKTLPVVNYTPTSTVVTPKTIPFTYSPSKGATPTLPISPSVSGANPSFIPTMGLSSSTVFHTTNYSKTGNAVANYRIKPSSSLSGSKYTPGGNAGENGLGQESNETIQNEQIDILNAYIKTLPPEELKISTDLLILINPDFPVFSPDFKQNIYNSLVRINVIIPASQLGYQGEIVGDVVAVHIWLDPGSNLDLIQPYVLKEFSRDTGKYGEDYWQINGLVPLKNLRKIASMNNVRNIFPIYPSFNK
ncbi:MAG: hypothetical protein WCJ93_11835 [Methanomicrobiales archaeon]